MPSPTPEGYSYYPTIGYPNAFFDGTTPWATSSADTLSYLGSYGQQPNVDYMQQFPGFGYNTAGFWNSYSASDYPEWSATSVQQDPMKIVDGQTYMPSMDQAYGGVYPSPAGNHQLPVTNGQDVVVEGDEVVDLDQSLQKVTVSGDAEDSQESPSETSLHESSNINNSSASASNLTSQQPKSVSWANIAKTPAKPVPVAPKILTRPSPPAKSVSENSWEKGASRGGSGGQNQRTSNWSAPRSNRNSNASNADRTSGQRSEEAETDTTLSQLKQSNAYNPKSFELNPKNARFFVIKSYSEDDIHRAIKYRVWCSTEHGNKRLDDAFKDREGKGPIYLFYSVNGSGHFCGMAQMMSGVDYQTHAGVWTQDKWKGSMEIKWIYVKDVPNSVLRHIRLENNENKPVTNSRDTQEVPYDKGRQVLKHIHNYKHTTSIFDDFSHYEKKEVEEGGDMAERKKMSPKIFVSISQYFF